jgi:hypothetical protein
LQNKTFKIVPLGSYTTTEVLFSLFVTVLEGFCWNTFQDIGYALLDNIQSTKIGPSEAWSSKEEEHDCSAAAQVFDIFQANE